MRQRGRLAVDGGVVGTLCRGKGGRNVREREESCCTERGEEVGAACAPHRDRVTVTLSTRQTCTKAIVTVQVIGGTLQAQTRPM